MAAPINIARVKERWAGLPPRVRSVVSVAGLAVVMLFISSLVVKSAAPTAKKAAKEATTTNLMLPSHKDITVEGLAGTVDATKEQVARLAAQTQRDNEQTQALLKQMQEARPQDNASAELAREVLALRQQVDAMKSSKEGPKGAPSAPSLNDGLPGSQGPQAQPASSEPPQDAGPSLRVIGASKPAKKEAAAQGKPIGYLTAGSIFEGVLLNGMDAPTTGVTQKNPVPALIRIKTDAILPNLYNHDIKECFALVSGYGVLATERAQLRTETLSCINDKGEVMETKLDGYVVGEDGKVGLRGRLVSKQGQMIARSLVAGVFSGLGQNLAPASVPQLNISPGASQQYQSPNMGSVMQASAYQGFANASKDISQFFLQMAHEMFPVVEIDASRRVTIVLIRGTELSFGSK